MGSASDYLENKILNDLYGSGAPATVYVALFTVAPTDAGGGTEVAGGSYARVAKTNNVANWPAAVGGVKNNGSDVQFPTATANWGTVVAFGIFDAAVAGNLLHYGDVSPNFNVVAGLAPKFPLTSGLTITQT